MQQLYRYEMCTVDWKRLKDCESKPSKGFPTRKVLSHWACLSQYNNNDNNDNNTFGKLVLNVFKWAVELIKLELQKISLCKYRTYI